MIEVSDKKYWKEMNYYDGLLYCQLLNIDGKNDWRLISESDYVNCDNQILDEFDKSNALWFIDFCKCGRLLLEGGSHTVVPVRDI